MAKFNSPIHSLVQVLAALPFFSTTAAATAPLSNKQLIPANAITACYDSDANSLLLYASGTHVDITKDIAFVQKPLDGGLLFDLQGQVGPVTNGQSYYEITDNFDIELPNMVYPSDTVVVNTENHKQWVVDILYSDDGCASMGSSLGSHQRKARRHSN
ncbi:hypothetical protein FPRO03_11921 [Fusarium proliferatum]|uniref:ML-like domain-containing protein n=1 Tax=Gibberella intermedia TaxID=948311 RepID=A0A365N4C5_GIBIN|nr:hypothetical protein FPRO03_11921 [Fusarium proliferatum]RBA15659.1 hypothetical protein FPRO05_12266 [Fusarium proliferatum]